MNPILRGIFPALITPLNEDGTAVNYDSLGQVVAFHLERGVSGFFVCGGSGEGILLTEDERRRILEAVVDHSAGRARIIAHVGAVATQTGQALAAHAAELGVDAIAAIPPIYFRVDDQALKEHYRLIAEAAGDTPIYLYNIPGTTGVRVTADLMKELLDIPNVSGIKYSDYNLYEMQQIAGLRPDLTVLNGYDQVCLAGLMMGAHGGIGSTYNVLPATFSALYRAYMAGNYDQARSLQRQINHVLQKALLTVPLIAGVKVILTEWGYPCGTPRRPQRPLTATERETLLSAVDAVGLEALEQRSMQLMAALPADIAV